jgi:hypothetical protein
MADFVAKSFWGAERKFLEPLMRLAPRDVRDLIVSEKNDHGPSYWRYGALQRWSCLKYYFREILGVVRFSTFATKSARSCAFQPIAKRTFVERSTSERCPSRRPRQYGRQWAQSGYARPLIRTLISRATTKRRIEEFPAAQASCWYL